MAMGAGKEVLTLATSQMYPALALANFSLAVQAALLKL